MYRVALSRADCAAAQPSFLLLLAKCFFFFFFQSIFSCLVRHEHIPSRQKLAGASLLVFANKQDLAGALEVKEIADVLGLESKQFANRHWSIVGCSAVTGEGLAKGVDWMVSDIGSRIFMMS